MKHRVLGRKLNRTKKHREALFANLMTALFEHGQIKTSQAKAKAIQSMAEKAITTAKKQSVPSRRKLAETFGKRQTVNLLTDEITKMTAVRTSGYTRIVSLGERRGDNTPMVRLELIDYKKAEPVKIEEAKKAVVEKKPTVKKAVKAAPKKATEKEKGSK